MAPARQDKLVAVSHAIGRGIAWFFRHVLWNVVRFTMWAMLIVGFGLIVFILSSMTGKNRLTGGKMPPYGGTG
jgi:predicted DNA repair protein MutK